MSKPYKYYYIYKIINSINKKCYVGFHATNYEFDKDLYFGSGKLIKYAINKYGIENFLMGIIEYVTIENWQEKEKYWIDKMNSSHKKWGYNLNVGGRGNVGYKWTDEQRAKINMAGSKNGMYGRHHSKESLKKISDTRILNKNTVGAKNGMYKTSAYKKWVKLYGKEKADIKEKEKRLKISKNSKRLSHIWTDKQKEKLSSSLKKIKKIQCIWCKKYTNPSPHILFHGDNCKLNPNYNLEEHLIICPHCNTKNKSQLNMNKYHFDNCKLNPNYNLEEHLIICPHCNVKSINKANMKRYHFNNCKFK